MKNQRYYFTFTQSSPLKNCYKLIEANSYEEAREIMVEQFGNNWAFQYDEESWYVLPSEYTRPVWILTNTPLDQKLPQSIIFNLKQL